MEGIYCAKMIIGIIISRSKWKMSTPMRDMQIKRGSSAVVGIRNLCMAEMNILLTHCVYKGNILQDGYL